MMKGDQFDRVSCTYIVTKGERVRKEARVEFTSSRKGDQFYRVCCTHDVTKGERVERRH